MRCGGHYHRFLSVLGLCDMEWDGKVLVRGDCDSDIFTIV
jgi:hypothetical protein